MVIRAGWAVWISVGRPRWRGFADGRTIVFSSSSSGICLATSILGRSATWPTSALLARRRRRRLHMAPPPPAKRARFLLVIRPRELLFPPSSPPRKLARGETGSSGEEMLGKSDRLEEEENAGCKSVKRVMAPLQKNAARRTRLASPSAFPPRRCRPLPRTSAWLPPRRPRRKRRANSSIPTVESADASRVLLAFTSLFRGGETRPEGFRNLREGASQLARLSCILFFLLPYLEAK